MFILYTDFGLEGPYVGQLKLVLAEHAGHLPVVDLMHDAPRFHPRHAAYLLASLYPYINANAIVIGVVDPGVGDESRRPIAIEADGRWYVGPDNGLFVPIIRRASMRRCWQLSLPDHPISMSFHGRDLFAPQAAELAIGEPPRGQVIAEESLVGYEWPDSLWELIYFDHYGNAVTGITANDINLSSSFHIAGQTIHYSPTFSSVSVGDAFWYVNSNGLIEFAINQGSAQTELGLKPGMSIEKSA